MSGICPRIFTRIESLFIAGEGQKQNDKIEKMVYMYEYLRALCYVKATPWKAAPGPRGDSTRKAQKIKIGAKNLLSSTKLFYFF